jgi:hypothetical protein
VVATLPSQAGWFGVQSRGLQTPVSQYAVPVHVVAIDSESPSALQAMTSFPWQRRAFG